METLVLILGVLKTALAVADAASPVYTFLTSVVSRLEAAQAENRDLTAEDWAYIDQLAAQYLTQLKGYHSVTAALLALAPAQPPTGT